MYGNNAFWKSGGRGYGTGRLGLDHNCHAKEFGFHPIYHEEAVQRFLVGAWHDPWYFSMITPAAQRSNRKMGDGSGGLNGK